MKILTEADLRSARLAEGTKEYRVERGTYVTPSAREFLADRGVSLVEAERGMPRYPVQETGPAPYRDAETGAPYAYKPEFMTHLRGNLLVPKTNPRILLRGKLDSFEAALLLLQTEWSQQPELYQALEELLAYTRSILGAEVREVPLEPKTLLGMGEEALRHASHHIPEELGIPHPVPNARMGRVVLGLNWLRTQSRECELAAAAAFGAEGRPDLLQALNRLSSALYLIMCRELARQSGEDKKV